MKLHIKNMVCSRCKMVVQWELEKLDLHPVHIELGEVHIEEELSQSQLSELDAALKASGFSLLEDKKSRLVEKIKNAIVALVHNQDNKLNTNLSQFLSDKLHQDYSSLSNLFSQQEGMTIEHYYMVQKIEKVKEFIVYDELTLSEIAFRLHYSSVAHLSRQFKKITGLTPSFFRQMKNPQRLPLEKL